MFHYIVSLDYRNKLDLAMLPRLETALPFISPLLNQINKKNIIKPLIQTQSISNEKYTLELQTMFH